ncbi:MAG: hypothetical protein ACOX7R_03655 [Acetivibrionales bacterium]|jgi:hypothetical protein
MIKTEEEVEVFLDKIHAIIEEDERNLVLLGRTKGLDKTDVFMKEYNIKHKMICDELLKLSVLNYSYTEYDDNPKWKHEEIWVFGKFFMVEGIECNETIYIKLKLRNNVICMSFHPQVFSLKYPYL